MMFRFMDFLFLLNVKFTGSRLCSAIQRNDLFAALFVMCPHTYDLHGLYVIEDLIDKTMLKSILREKAPVRLPTSFS